MSHSSPDKEIKNEPPSIFQSPKEENLYGLENDGGSKQEEQDVKSPLDDVCQQLEGLRGLTTRSMIHVLESMERISRENKEMKERMAAIEAKGNNSFVHNSSPESDSSFSSTSSSSSSSSSTSFTRSRDSRDRLPDRYRRYDDSRTYRRDRSRSPNTRYSSRQSRDHGEPRRDNQVSNYRPRPQYVPLPYAYVNPSYRVYSTPYGTSFVSGWGYASFGNTRNQIAPRGYNQN